MCMPINISAKNSSACEIIARKWQAIKIKYITKNMGAHMQSGLRDEIFNFVDIKKIYTLQKKSLLVMVREVVNSFTCSPLPANVIFNLDVFFSEPSYAKTTLLINGILFKCVAIYFVFHPLIFQTYYSGSQCWC